MKCNEKEIEAVKREIKVGNGVRMATNPRQQYNDK